jgi:exonuclease SbcC
VSGAELACREVAERASQVTERAQARRDRRVDDEHFSRLAATVGGTASDNALRMRLSAFVLAGRLERVVDLANERLVSIGAGRYRLAHTDDVASHGRRSGLGLVVHDLWTGRTRDPATLSGGESFMASLALALGLADAVRQESGGFDLQTLFIDEGFGTLDEESLEHVMEILDTLRDGGRAVGVVSHVVDLRSRIPTQLRVHKSTQGSSVSVVGMPA